MKPWTAKAVSTFGAWMFSVGAAAGFVLGYLTRALGLLP